MISTAVEIVLALIVVTIAYIKWCHQYWKRHKFPYLEPSFPLGHSQNPLRIRDSLGNHMKTMYDRTKQNGWRYCGLYFFTKPVFYAIDPDFYKHILATDFQYFADRATYYNEKDDPLSATMIALEGYKWRKLRNKVIPAFTSGKIKAMFQTLLGCQDSLKEAMDNYCQRQEPVDIKELFARFTTDFIGSCAFGLECNSFKDGNSPFRLYGKKIFNRDLARIFLFSFCMSYPQLSRKLGIRALPKDVTDFFMGVIKDTVDYREKNNFTRSDFMQLLIELKNNKSKEEGLTLNELAAQCLVFFAAGFETSSSTSTFILYELAKNPRIQEKLREEVDQVLDRYDGQMTYDAINDMKYMGQVIDESLRKYPAAPFLTRRCVQDYLIPGDNVVLQKGVTVLVPILGVHWDPDFYPEPEKFDPDRFSEEAKASRVPYTYIPFGEGPRICIGIRFGIMQTKVGLTTLMRNYTFTVNEKTREPLKMSPYSVVQSVDGDVWLNVTPRAHNICK